MEKLFNFELGVSNERVNRNDMRDYKSIFHNELAEILNEHNIDSTMIKNGMILEIPHCEQGSIILEAKFTAKRLDYDVIGANEEYLESLQAEQDRKAKRENDKKLDIERKEREAQLAE